MNFLHILETIGVFVFAISGTLAASEKKLDLFGGFIIAFVTATGGGTLRDLLLNTEINWIKDTTLIYVVISGTIFALLFKRYTRRIRKTLFLFDTIGISLFTINGVQTALSAETPLIVAIMLGVITASFGGVIRDILCNEIPLIFRKEIYATACIIGALAFVTLNHFGIGELYNTLISGGIIASIRTLAVIKQYRLPLINDRI